MVFQTPVYNKLIAGFPVAQYTFDVFADEGTEVLLRQPHTRDGRYDDNQTPRGHRPDRGHQTGQTRPQGGLQGLQLSGVADVHPGESGAAQRHQVGGRSGEDSVA